MSQTGHQSISGYDLRIEEVVSFYRICVLNRICERGIDMKDALATRCIATILSCGFAFAQGQTTASRFNSGNGTGLPVYPRAVASEHTDDRGTVSVVDGSQVHRLAANAYISSDKPGKVLQFYRDRLKSLGQVVECSGGKNKAVDVQLNDAAFADPSVCRADDFAAGGTELKVVTGGEQRIIVVLTHGNGSEIALVSVKP